MRMIRLIFVDTNVLVYRASRSSPFYNVAVATIDRLSASGAVFVSSPQIVREFLRAMLVSRNVLGIGDSQRLIEQAKAAFSTLQMLEETPAVLEKLYELCLDYPEMLRHVHDANIAATMLAHGVTELLTHNTKHFEPLRSLITITPLITPGNATP